MNKQVQLINDFCDDRIQLDNNYSFDELYVLMQLGVNDTNKDKIYNSSRKHKHSLYVKYLSSHTIASNINNLSLHGIIDDEMDMKHYVFKIETPSETYLQCHNARIYFCDNHKKYYTHEPYYLGDYYMFFKERGTFLDIRSCIYFSIDNIISPYWFPSDGRNVYHFRSRIEAEKAEKICVNNTELFKKIYHDKKISVEPPYISTNYIYTSSTFTLLW